MDGEDLARWRAKAIGLVFQDPHLLPGLTAHENVMVPRLPFEPSRTLAQRARDLLKAVGLEDRATFPAARLSGGERQRVGIARALIGQPPIVIADEPTGNLDDHSTIDILDVLARVRTDLGLTLIVATHDPIVVGHADREFRLTSAVP